MSIHEYTHRAGKPIIVGNTKLGLCDTVFTKREKFMLKQFCKMLAGFILVFLAACSSAGTTVVGNPSGNSASPTISIGQLQDDGQAEISIPLEVFGDAADDVDDATVDIDKNGARYSVGLDASSYYNLVAAAVSFTMSELASGDVIRFTVHLESGDDTIFVGTVSDTSATNASSSAVQQLIDTICTDLASCFDTSAYATCYTQMLATEQLDDELFTEASDVTENSLSLQDIEEDLSDGTTTADDTVLSACLTDLQSLTCDELAVGYSESSSADYENVENFVGDACADLFAQDTADNSTDDSTLPSNEIGDFIDTLCTSIDSCSTALSREDCQSGLLATKQLSPELFVEQDATLTDTTISLAEISDGLDGDDYSIDNDAYDACIADIEALSCTAIATGFDESDPTNFENVENFLPVSCEFLSGF